MSLRRSINLMCRQCIYDPFSGAGTWRQQVEACTDSRCPLYACRPLSKPKRDRNGVPAEVATEMRP